MGSHSSRKNVRGGVRGRAVTVPSWFSSESACDTIQPAWHIGTAVGGGHFPGQVPEALNNIRQEESVASLLTGSMGVALSASNWWGSRGTWGRQHTIFMRVKHMVSAEDCLALIYAAEVNDVTLLFHDGALSDTDRDAPLRSF